MPATTLPSKDEATPGPALPLPESATAGFLEEALGLGKRFLAEAREAPDGSLHWLKAVADAEGRHLPLGPHLHAGYGGIAIFLAALGRVTGEPSFRDAALRSLAPLRRQLRRRARQAGKLEWKLGAVTGLAGLVYTLLRVGAFAGEPALLEDACDAATLFTPENLAEDKFCDVMYGAAGALLVLLLLDAEAPEDTWSRLRPLERATACGERLLAMKVAGSGPSGWPSPIQPPGCGFAHGASGIALALGRLARRTGREDFRSAALSGLAFERPHYDPAIDNWLPVLGRPLRVLLNGWCNGAAGVALSRLGLGDLPDAEISRDLELALASVGRAAQANIDTICCGNFGRADILFEASQRMGRPELLETSRLIAARAMAAAKKNGGHYLTGVPEALTGGFYTGLPGIGYALLRLAGASGLPCVQAVD